MLAVDIFTCHVVRDNAVRAEGAARAKGDTGSVESIDREIAAAAGMLAG